MHSRGPAKNYIHRNTNIVQQIRENLLKKNYDFENYLLQFSNKLLSATE